ncbi:MAG: universal stress protein [Desulfobacterales bacterium]|nr:universal stress protein [Desulfobacterales bacterium]
MKTLVCVDGHDHALKAAKLAAKFACATNSEATFLFVRRYRKHTRGYNIRWKTTEIFADWRGQLPEVRFLHEAEDVFKKTRWCKENETEMVEDRIAMVHIGGGVFEEARVRMRSGSRAHLKIREGIPHEEILREAEEGRYDIVMLGARLIGGCRWYDIEHIPLTVAQKAPCPVAIIGKEFEEGQPVLLCIGKKPPPKSTLDLIRVIATRMKSEIEVLTVLRSADSTFRFSKNISATAMIDEWRSRSLSVTVKVLTGKPADVVLKTAPHYGLVICSSSEKPKRNRLGKMTKKVLCNQFNLLVLR